MIRFTTGNIMESSAEALVNTVNTVGVMGKGIALQFKNAFPANFKRYRDACIKGELETGKLLVVKDTNLLTGEKTIINFPTKRNWKNPSKNEYIASGLIALLNY
jgi:O-acetyl-ADP-ribose deacetylase (regulator of RNase III)